jgi:hypothetical protein
MNEETNNKTLKKGVETKLDPKEVTFGKEISKGGKKKTNLQGRS